MLCVCISNVQYVHATLYNYNALCARWAFALARLAHVAGDSDLARRALAMVQELHPFFVARKANGKPMGVRWKLNTDATPIPELGAPQPSNDAISGLVVYVDPTFSTDTTLLSPLSECSGLTTSSCPCSISHSPLK